MTSINALTLWEPYASLIAVGVKSVETRNWAAPAGAIGQPLAIHASKKLDGDALASDGDEAHALAAAGINPMTGLADGGFDWTSDRDMAWLDDRDPKHLLCRTRGCVVAVARLMGCYRMHVRPGFRVGYVDPVTKKAFHPSAQEERFGDWRPGRFAWVLTDVVRLPEPIPARGFQQIWQWEPPDELLAALGRQPESSAA